MIDARIPLRHQEMGTNVSMYITNIATNPAGQFSGPMVVSMRPIKRDQIVRAVQVTSRFPATHGAPVHIGDPAAIGIRDIAAPDFGDAVKIYPDEEPVFWACGVTPQAVALNCKPSLMMTHAPGMMFITDQRDAEYAVL
ncbi:Putative hydro-lyase Psyc_1103 [Geodia barretti]|uniref:Hydro-lyase Psyc_1103 n=2 Tax=Geodia barretti TaxID=519541 RepID=A0AA35WYU6_GEOBA|nr:Putative hydro-lyase Psyc_1103 [Geodia barretti]